MSRNRETIKLSAVVLALMLLVGSPAGQASSSKLDRFLQRVPQGGQQKVRVILQLEIVRLESPPSCNLFTFHHFFTFQSLSDCVPLNRVVQTDTCSLKGRQR
ncbi:MAG: hypothetical protein HY652_03225 [Acidobacteria bacterium]|nr:hypothetical protein [Acidobacteriota bacterium]